MNGLLTRMLGAACLNPHTFEEIEADPRATFQAVIVVILVSISAGIGGVLTYGIGGIIIGPLVGVIQWVVWAFVTYLVGTTILKTPETHADWGQLARTTGFAQTPGLLKILGFLPLNIGSVILFIASAWQLVAMVIAVRQALDYRSTWRAVAVVVISFIISMIPLIILQSLMSPSPAGI